MLTSAILFHKSIFLLLLIVNQVTEKIFEAKLEWGVALTAEHLRYPRSIFNLNMQVSEIGVK